MRLKQSKKVLDAFRAVEKAADNQAYWFSHLARFEVEHTKAKWAHTQALSDFRKVIEADARRVSSPKKASKSQ